MTAAGWGAAGGAGGQTSSGWERGPPAAGSVSRPVACQLRDVGQAAALSEPQFSHL